MNPFRMTIVPKGSFINHVDSLGGGLALFSKSDHEGGGGSKIPKNLTTWFMVDHLVQIILQMPLLKLTFYKVEAGF